jgi:hypothetical protein
MLFFKMVGPKKWKNSEIEKCLFFTGIWFLKKTFEQISGFGHSSESASNLFTVLSGQGIKNREARVAAESGLTRPCPW